MIYALYSKSFKLCLCEKQTEMKGFYLQNYHMALEDLVYSELYGLLLCCFYYAFWSLSASVPIHSNCMKKLNISHDQ